MSSAVGQDTITLQASQLSNICVPNPATGKHCDFFIGVFGWRNATYSLLAAVNNGFASSTLLLDRLPQSSAVTTGTYSYYKYVVGGGAEGALAGVSLPTSISITLSVRRINISSVDFACFLF
jgi:hypothetical protein